MRAIFRRSVSAPASLFALGAAALLPMLLALACSNPRKGESPTAPAAGATGMAVAGGATVPTSGEAGASGGGSQNPGGGAGAQGNPGSAGGSGPGSAGGSSGSASGPACGTKTCAAGQICCNASCGICTPPDGVCTQQICDAADAAAITPPGCKTDGDCRLFSDYCTGCDCRALQRGERDPVCSGPGVRCLVDPCQNKAAACQAGKCVTVNKTAPRK